MLSQSQRTTILELNANGVSRREIARVLMVSRLSVRKVLRSNSASVPEIHRAEKAEPYRQQILELSVTCKGNLVRVHEELLATGAMLSYTALTAFCRRHGIGQAPAAAVGRYHFDPGVEMQHDTSPHEVEVGGRNYRAQTASAVLCYSRLLFFQIYPAFQRFDCKVFLTEALKYMGGVPGRVMIDNTHVIVLRGTGSEMIPVAEMEAFAERFGFHFVAHERGDANRSARVERPFSFIENNFLAGRTFSDWDGLNQQARQWCDKVNSTYKKHIRAVPRELFAVERMHLKPLPAWITNPCKDQLRQVFSTLDPVALLSRIREAQRNLACREVGGENGKATETSQELSRFVDSLSTAWRDGEVRATHRKQATGPRPWRTRVDPFQDVWFLIEQWLNEQPDAT